MYKWTAYVITTTNQNKNKCIIQSYVPYRGNVGGEGACLQTNN